MSTGRLSETKGGLTMQRVLRLIFAFILIVTGFIMVFPPSALALPDNCVEGEQVGGAIYRICMPPEGFWNGDLFVYAHGYVAPNEPVGIPEDQLFLPDGTYIPENVTGMGYAFATTSYRKNGLAVREGIKDIRNLVRIFKKTARGILRHVYLVGASEGGQITALAVERYPREFSGGMALCGPIGDFQRHMNYRGDFRVVFDYFFPNILPPSPIAIPDYVIENWNSFYMPSIIYSVATNPSAATQLLQVTQAPIDPGDSSSIFETILGTLWFNIVGTNDAIEELHGQPFDNQDRVYVGSLDDDELNMGVERFSADPSASSHISAHYETSGHLKSPLVTIHNTLDPIVPYWHEVLYGEKILASNATDLYSHILVNRYGHCNFTSSETMAGFAILVGMVTGQ
jgi:pimeloyl-ACP methyl ester carboxylesterase